MEAEDFRLNLLSRALSRTYPTRFRFYEINQRRNSRGQVHTPEQQQLIAPRIARAQFSHFHRWLLAVGMYKCAFCTYVYVAQHESRRDVQVRTIRTQV